jgi:hypothetical protein
MPDHALLPQLGERLELRTDGVRGRRPAVYPGEGPEVDHIEHIEPEPAKVVMHLRAQRLRRVAGQPAAPSSRTTPTLVTMCTSLPYGESASRMISLVMYGP